MTKSTDKKNRKVGIKGLNLNNNIFGLRTLSSFIFNYALSGGGFWQAFYVVVLPNSTLHITYVVKFFRGGVVDGGGGCWCKKMRKVA